MGDGKAELVMIETVSTFQIALVRKVQEHEVQHTRRVERIEMPIAISEFDFLHKPFPSNDSPRRLSGIHRRYLQPVNIDSPDRPEGTEKHSGVSRFKLHKRGQIWCAGTLRQNAFHAEGYGKSLPK